LRVSVDYYSRKNLIYYSFKGFIEVGVVKMNKNTKRATAFAVAL
jgi:hypothetical protein